MSRIRAMGNELQIGKEILRGNTDPAKIKGWISQIDLLAENLK
ncbi:MAG TPA: hypothetical protein VEC43_05130 [Candidatus Acidoferrales bacterium]|nr:hypothetical protein [Candidatus Acidoferrales bacterium]